ncbi:brassinosteroid-responsive RING protein 1 [Cryptomeria japonica]|uniref:brassinosteroid-responsive RING protein 1 n=1 Tax=Cryptomeria japonica TaxID=3369 RepID=UPI0025AC12BD|nr:brassinosteroid-responsive RING protein 1 [Cryptomeria japonica]
MMGFPAGYSEFIISKVLFNAVFLLSSIRNGICWLLSFIGLAEFLEQEFADLTERSAAACSATAYMIRERLPVVTFGVLTDSLDGFDEVSCSVCLNEFAENEEIRQLTNCCHIFHKNCLDKWLDHDQKTCPLCRTCLMPEKIENDETEGSWAVERLLYLFGEDMVFQSQHTTQIR